MSSVGCAAPLWRGAGEPSPVGARTTGVFRGERDHTAQIARNTARFDSEPSRPWGDLRLNIKTWPGGRGPLCAELLKLPRGEAARSAPGPGPRAARARRPTPAGARPAGRPAACACWACAWATCPAPAETRDPRCVGCVRRVPRGAACTVQVRGVGGCAVRGGGGHPSAKRHPRFDFERRRRARPRGRAPPRPSQPPAPA